MITLALVEQLPKRLDHRVEGVQCWIRVAQRRQCLALLRLQHRGIPDTLTILLPAPAGAVVEGAEFPGV